MTRCQWLIRVDGVSFGIECTFRSRKYCAKKERIVKSTNVVSKISSLWLHYLFYSVCVCVSKFCFFVRFFLFSVGSDRIWCAIKVFLSSSILSQYIPFTHFISVHRHENVQIFQIRTNSSIYQYRINQCINIFMSFGIASSDFALFIRVDLYTLHGSLCDKKTLWSLVNE